MSILESEIAKLVLGLLDKVWVYFFHYLVIYRLIYCAIVGYLRDECHDKVVRAFCKSSPHLRAEYEYIRKGIRLRSLFNYDLIAILDEYSEVKHIGKLHKNYCRSRTK